MSPGERSRGVGGMRFWIVPHTHWDREWFLPFEEFRIRLGRTVDELLDILESNPSFRRFTLDGQMVLLEDYAEIRPHQESRLLTMIRDGRIAVGPSYVLPDEYLVGGESLVRNLLMGRHVCQRYGVEPMAVGYMPDTFGHVAQLPQILRGFGLDGFVFWRGVGEEGERLGAVFRWEAPDGSWVLAIRQLNGYSSANELGRWVWGQTIDQPEFWPDGAVRRVREFVDHYRAYYRQAGLRDVLLCNGNDHQPVQRDLTELVRFCADQMPEAQFQISGYEDYLAAVRDCADQAPRFSGELCAGRSAPVLRGVNSARMYLKQANEATERALFVAEALSSLAALAGANEARLGPYPGDELRVAWRELLRNQPHDSICGCSVDQVHRDMQQRWATAQTIAGRLQREAVAALAKRDCIWWHRDPPEADWSLINPLPWGRRAVVEVPYPPSLKRSGGIVTESPAGALPVQAIPARRAAFVAADVPGFGGLQLRLRRGDDAWVGGARAAGPAAIENEFYRVEAGSDGGLDVLEKRSGRRWRGQHWFEDEADRGDEYNFCPLEGDAAWTNLASPARAKVSAGGPVVAELAMSIHARLPRALARGRKARSRALVLCPIRSVVRLAHGIDRVEFRTYIVNRARDHRLRVVFRNPEAEDKVWVEGHFAALWAVGAWRFSPGGYLSTRPEQGDGQLHTATGRARLRRLAEPPRPSHSAG